MSPTSITGENWQTTMLGIVSCVYGTFLYTTIALAEPTITFPINSQVPPVVRVSVPYTFTFSASTFSGTSPLSYHLSNAPIWLSLDGLTRTLSGVAPESAANTAPIIQITASDNSGSVTMNATLVVSGNPAPTVIIPLEDQLATLGTYSLPSSILYYPSTPFNFAFDPGTFGHSALNHYAVTTDNTPLPAWITFDRTSLSFFGKTPEASSLVQPPQVWGLQLIASDILGFAGTAIKFNIVVGNHKLDFEDGFLNINATVGLPLNFTGLMGSLRLDGKTPDISDIVSAYAETPDWLTFSNSTFFLSGTPPPGTTSFSVLVTVEDIHEDIVNAIVLVHIASSIFLETVISLNATIGMPFSFDVGSLFSNASDVAVSVQIDPLTPWLSFNTETLSFSGNVPPDTQPSKIRITIEAVSKSSYASGTQILTLIVQSMPSQVPSTITSATSTPTASSTDSASLKTFKSSGLSRGEIAAIAISVVLVSIASLFLLFHFHRQRKQDPGRRKGSPNKHEISNPIQKLNQAEGKLESQDQVISPYHDSKRHKIALKRHSQAMSKLFGGESMNIRDSQSSGAHGRSYSENALSDFGSTWRYTQDSAYPPLRISMARYPSIRNTRNFSRKTGALASLTDKSSVGLIGSIASKRISKGSRSSIQQTPDFAYNSENMEKQGHSQRCIPDYLGIPGIGRRLSGIGHGSQMTSAGYPSMDENRCSSGFGHGTSNQNPGPQSCVAQREGNSWMTIRSAGFKERHRQSLMSVLTESTELLSSPKKMTLRQVPKSPSQPSIARVSTTSKSSQTGSKRAVGSSPFFAGSSRAGSQGASRKSPMLTRDRYMYPHSPSSRGQDAAKDGLKKPVEAEPRNVELSLSNQALSLPRDSLGTTYGSPREGTRQLRDYVNQLSHRVSHSFSNSLHLSDSDSRFRSAEPSPQSQHYKESQNEESDHDHYSYSPRGNGSPASFNRDRYGLDESPQLEQAMGAQTVVRPGLLSLFTDSSSLERQISHGEMVREQYMPSPGRPASSYENAIFRKESLEATHYDGGLDEADVSLDGVHGAFL